MLVGNEGRIFRCSSLVYRLLEGLEQGLNGKCFALFGFNFWCGFIDMKFSFFRLVSAFIFYYVTGNKDLKILVTEIEHVLEQIIISLNNICTKPSVPAGWLKLVTCNIF